MIHKTTRSILSVLLAVLLLVTSTPLTPAFAGEGAVSLQSESGESEGLTGDGTREDPYQIGSAEQLAKFRDKVNSGETDASAVLTDDINLNPNMDISEDGTVTTGNEPDRWIPIGNEDHRYTGTFDGDGHTIRGLYINDSTADDQGLFGYVGTGGTVKDLTVSGSVKGDDYVGGVVGYNDEGRVENCHNIGSVSGERYVGGVVGYNSSIGNVKNCYNTGKVIGSGNSVGGVGGVVGYNRGSVENCHNTGTVTVTGTGTDYYVGGVVGYNGSSSTVENCYNTGKVSGPDSGNISGYSYVGGVVGLNRGTVENCYNTGTVSSNSNTSDVGGVVGCNGGTVDNGGTVENCYNTGKVTGISGNRYVGGVVGYNISSVTNCYFLKDTAGSGIGSGKPSEENVKSLTAEEFKNTDSFIDWDFGSDGIWETNTTLGRPVLTSNHEDDGSKDHPYEIFTATQLENFRDLVNRGGAGARAHAKLMNDINLKDVCGESNSWIPIGNFINSYEGTFDGNGKTISGLYIGSSGVDYKGLFGRVNGGTVQDLTVSGSVSGHWYVGGVVGYNNGGTVTGCTFSVSGNVSGDWHVGGVVGYNNGGTVTGCIFSGSGSVSGNRYVGGVVGYNSSGTVTNCAFSGTVTGIYVGGVVGENSGSNGSVEKCHNTGSVNGNVNSVGGVVGNNEASVENCTNTGSVNGSAASSNVVGVVGLNRGSVENCYNTVSVSGDWYVGGVVGRSDGSVKNCTNTGSVNGSAASSNVGGVVGQNFGGTVENCYNTGEVSGKISVGGVVGDNSGIGSVTNCYFLQTDDVNENLPGIGNGSGDAAEKDDTAFHSGEVAWRLQDGQADGSSQVWGQNLMNEPKDNYPQLRAFDADTPQVYKVAFMNDSEEHDAKYANNGMTVGSPTTNPTKEGYTFAGWKDENDSVPSFPITVSGNLTYTAKWTAEEPPYTGKYSYEVFTSVGDNGTVTVDRYATEGDKVTIDVAPDQAYKLDDLSVTAHGKDVELTANSDGTYTFTMPSADVRITATFAEDPDWTPDEPEEPATDVSDLFIDIAPDAWYKDAIQYAYDNGLMTGVSATEFAPEQTTTRAMIVSILARLENVTTAEAAGFADVDDNDWYATAVNWAANVGVVNGYEDNTFKPNTAITREQLAAILMNYAAYKGYDVSARADLSHYSDADSISSWANDVLLWAVAEGLLTGVTDDTIAPQAHATRAQVAAILQRFLSE